MHKKEKTIILLFSLCMSTTLAQAGPEISQKKKYRGYLGVRLAELTPEERSQLSLKKNQGVKILGVVPGSPAEKTDFTVSDIVLSCNRKPVGNTQALTKYIQNLGADANVEMTILRKGKKKKVTATLVPHPQDLLEEPDPSPEYFKVKMLKDIQYFTEKDRGNDKHKLNLILPKTDTPFSLVMWIHGGGWSFGDRSRETALGVRFAERGIGFAPINHRLSSGAWKNPGHPKVGVKHPEHVKDCARAFAWLRTHISSYGGDPNKIFVGGYSSGAHLATLLTLDPRYLNEHNLSTNTIKGVIAIGGAYNLVKYHDFLVNARGENMADAHLKAVFGQTIKSWQEASPTTYIQNCNVPMIMIAEKNTGLRQYMDHFKQSLSEDRTKFFKFLVAEDRSHKQSMAMMSRKGEDPIRDAVIEFIRNCCKDVREKR